MQKIIYTEIDTYTHYFYASELKYLKLPVLFFLLSLDRKYYRIEASSLEEM